MKKESTNLISVLFLVSAMGLISLMTLSIYYNYANLLQIATYVGFCVVVGMTGLSVVTYRPEKIRVVRLSAALIVLSLAAFNSWQVVSLNMAYEGDQAIHHGIVTGAYQWSQGVGTNFQVDENLTVSVQDGGTVRFVLACSYYKPGDAISFKTVPGQPIQAVNGPSGCEPYRG